MKKLIWLNVLVVLVLLAGCTASPAATPTAPAGSDLTPTETAAAQATVEPTAGPSDEPVAEPTAAPTDGTAGDAGGELKVLVHDSFSASEEVIREFESQNNIKLNFIKGGDAGSALNQAILSKDAPPADILYGVDNSFLSRALDEGIFEPYQASALEEIPAEFKLDEENRALPVDYGDVCINYDQAFFTEKNLAVPASLEDLAKPEYKDMLVVENPSTSSPGLAFLIATVSHFGPDGYLDYWQSLKDNGMVVVNDWEAAYYTNFSGSSGRGPQPMVVSYATSPAAEMIFAETRPETAPTASITAPGTCFRQVEFVGILKGTQNRAAAEKFVDFLLSKTFQEDIPMQMFVYPVLPSAELPADFQQYALQADQPAVMAPAEIAANRDAWIQAWNEAILK